MLTNEEDGPRRSSKCSDESVWLSNRITSVLVVVSAQIVYQWRHNLSFNNKSMLKLYKDNYSGLEAHYSTGGGRASFFTGPVE